MKFIIKSSEESKKRISSLFAEYYNPELNKTLIIDTNAPFIKNTSELSIYRNEDIRALAPLIPFLTNLKILNLHIKPWEKDNYTTERLVVPESVQQLSIHNTYIQSVNFSDCHLKALSIISNPILYYFVLT